MKVNLKMMILIITLACMVPLHSEGYNFAFNIAILKWDDTNYTAEPIKGIIKFNNGDRFQIYLKPDSSVYCYIVYEDINKSAQPIFNQKLTINQDYFFPSKESHFQIEPPSGLEKFHVILSSEPVPSLDNKIQSGDLVGLLDEILRFKQSILSFAEAPERPVPMGGVSRSNQAFEASSFFGEPYYVKTIRFKH